jgi:hypothetical protein
MIRLSIAAFLLASGTVMADGPADNKPESVRPVPPPGVPIDDAKRKELTAGLEKLEEKIASLKKSKSPDAIQFLPDVEIFSKAIRIALTEDGFFDVKEVSGAEKVLAEGLRRADELALADTRILSWRNLGSAANPSTNGYFTTVRGFRSKLDGSLQPYGVVYRPRMTTDGTVEKRADIWCRGRSEKGLEMQFLSQRMSNPEPAPAPGVIMIHPFGRYCNANKLAGEIDTLEALEHAKSEYRIDPEGVAIRGFSMGGAAAWHLAVHYPDKWFAANPGAGFSETPKFLNVFQSETLTPTPFEQTLWKLYDCPYWALNLRNLPTIAYSGAIDRQKQAADVMAEACWNLPDGNQFELTHVIAPNTAHKVEPKARAEIERRLNLIYENQSKKPRNKLWFTTYTLKYNQCHWLTVERLEKHWEPATVIATIELKEGQHVINVFPTGLTSFSIHFDPGEISTQISSLPVQIWDGAAFFQGNIQRRSDFSWSAHFEKVPQSSGPKFEWRPVSPLTLPQGLAKKHNLQGPIDDAFLSSFLFVAPDGKGQHPEVDQWVQSEWDRALREWHRQMRGDIRVVPIADLKEVDIQENNLILWGDPKSNSKLASILEKLPIRWDATNLSLGTKTFDAKSHVPVMIYPNPLNPERYVVLNSSFTYREYDYLNNARQVPKLPDWGVIDIRTSPGTRWPGKVAEAGFFGEKWELP